MSDWLPAWLTIDRAIAIATVAVAAMAASFSFWSVLLTRRAQKSQKEIKLPVLVFGVDPNANEGGWHWASLQRSSHNPMNFDLLNVAVGRGFKLVPSIANREPAVTGVPRPLFVPSPGAPSRTLTEWKFQNLYDPARFDAVFFLRPSGTVWRRRSSRVSLRLTLEEMSPERRRTMMTIKSNTIDWKASAAR